MSRLINFAPGPSTLFDAVLKQAQHEFLEWQGTGCSVAELSHRSQKFFALVEASEELIRQLLSVPENYDVLFMHGGATGQFAAVPMNLCANDTAVVDYFRTGDWSAKAIKEAEGFAKVNIAGRGVTEFPPEADWQLSKQASYIHLTSNESISGVEYPHIDSLYQRADGVPVVTDMCSNLMARPFDISHYGVIYASTQKNLGISGLAVVIIRKDLIADQERERQGIPSILNYRIARDNDSLFNTPNTFSWYMLKLTLEHLVGLGGLSVVEETNKQKAGLLYDIIDQSSLYSNPVKPAYRSTMNVPFFLQDAKLDAKFLQQAEAQGLLYLKGHKKAGGMRASIYNAMKLSSVQSLCDFMQHFEKIQA